MPLEDLRGLLGNQRELVQQLSESASLTSEKRYTYAESKKERILTWIFQQSFQYNPDHVIAVAKVINNRLPNIPYLSAAIRAINVWAVLWNSPQTILGFAWNASFDAVIGVWNASKALSYKFRRISSNAEKERLGIYRKQALGVWKQCYLYAHQSF